MSPPWFHVAIVPEAGELAWIERREAKHAAGARRLRAGDAVRLFDGAGSLAHATLTDERDGDGNLGVAVQVVERVSRPAPVIIASAIPKGDRVSTLLDMATQVGMTRFVPLDCAHGVVEFREKHVERWRRIVLEACKQSRRAWLPTIDDDARTPAIFCRDAMASGVGVEFAHPGGEPLDWSDRSSGAGRALVIGPEGGFSDDEVQAMREAGASQVSLGSAILRIEAACVVGAARLAGI